MANITKYLEKGLLGYSVGKSVTGFTPPGSTYAALFITPPSVNYLDTTAEDGVEVSGTGYTRKSITWGDSTASTDLTNSSSIKNSAEIKWGVSPVIGSNWTGGLSSNITTICIFDNLTVGSGNLLWFGPLSTSITLTTGDTFTILANSLTLTLG